MKHLIWLVIGALVSFLLWLGWLLGGMDYAYDAVVDRAKAAEAQQSASAATQATSDSRAISEPEPDTVEEVNDPDRRLSDFGLAGDSFGALNSLFTALAGAIVLWAGGLQLRALRHSEEVAEQQRKHMQRQAFESLFFRLLDLSNAAASRFRRKLKNGVTRDGLRALESYAHSVISASGIGRGDANTTEASLEALLSAFERQFYSKAPSVSGPYFRLLYQTFVLIENANLDADEANRYSRIARGQIPEAVVLLVALNGLTRRGSKFKALVERYGLLEHMHSTHRPKVEGALKSRYASSAFLGSVGRSISSSLDAVRAASKGSAEP